MAILKGVKVIVKCNCNWSPDRENNTSHMIDN